MKDFSSLMIIKKIIGKLSEADYYKFKMNTIFIVLLRGLRTSSKKLNTHISGSMVHYTMLG
jgi:hypothetical protein